MSKRSVPVLASFALFLFTIALAVGPVGCDDETIHPLPLDAGVTEIDAAPPPPVDSGSDAAADAAPHADAGPADATAPDASSSDASSDATAD